LSSQIQQAFLDSFTKSIVKKIAAGKELTDLDRVLIDKLDLDLEKLGWTATRDKEDVEVLESLSGFKKLCMTGDGLLLYYPVWWLVGSYFPWSCSYRIGSFVAVSLNEFRRALTKQFHEDQVQPRLITASDPEYGGFFVVKSSSFLRDLPCFIQLRAR